MKFLIDRCAGHKLAQWLRSQGYDVVESRERGDDPGDYVLLKWAFTEKRILITIDTDFGRLIFIQGLLHCGLIRLPDVPANKRIEILKEVLQKYTRDIQDGSIITVRGNKIRISKSV
ncbi:MAG TPA: DUF5615 family PIN-like protein [Candidatus Eremiobacteraeota bacterium]|nr:MAG: hypothetical protein BWY64_00913 [bacterium ADurb.Bin363]HPZ07855.1 DUF5615 family PIN-like protein [Candidatus Eremiobacteraeota bacterium]